MGLLELGWIRVYLATFEELVKRPYFIGFKHSNVAMTTWVPYLRYLGSYLMTLVVTQLHHLCLCVGENTKYRIVANASPSRFEAHVGLFRLLMKGIFDPYVL